MPVEEDRWSKQASKQALFVALIAVLGACAEPADPVGRAASYEARDRRDSVMSDAHAASPRAPGSRCDPDAIVCGGHCAPIARDAHNCGLCGVNCGLGEACVRGECTGSADREQTRPPHRSRCHPGWVDCGHGCVEPHSDAARDACGNAVEHFLPDPPGASHFPFYLQARPAIVNIGDPFIFEVAGAGEATQSLAFKPTTGEWRDVLGTGTPSSIQFVSGAVGANVDPGSVTSWGAVSAVYVLTADTGELMEVSFDAMGTPSWQSLSDPGGPNEHLFFFNPPLAAAFSARSGEMVVATVEHVSSLPAHDDLWICTRANTMTPCAWERASIEPGAPPLTAEIQALTIDTRCGTDEYSLYMVTPAFELARFRSSSRTWDPPSQPLPREVDGTGLQAWTTGSTCFVAAAGLDTATQFDTLDLASFDGTTVPWSVTWTDLIANSAPATAAPQAISGKSGNIAHGVIGGVDTLWAFEERITPASGHTAWRCALTASATPTCAWTSLGDPADGHAGFTMMAAGDTVYTTGHNGSIAVYVWGSQGAEWQNHLTRRDSVLEFADPAGSGVAEIVSAEHDGTVLYVAQESIEPGQPVTWISHDDGSTLAPLAFPTVPNPNGDLNVVFDAAGRGYATTLTDVSISPLGPIPGNTRISALQSGPVPTWRDPPTLVPTMATITQDRPDLAADAITPGMLYMTFSRSLTEGRFTYCNGAADCSDGHAMWCPAGTDTYVLPSFSGCTHRTQPGCWLDADPNGGVWLSVGDDMQCPPPSIANAHTAVVGIYNLSIPTGRPTCLDTHHFQQQLGSPVACITYVYAADPGQCNGGDGSPCLTRRWSSQLSVAQDQPGVVALAIQAYRDVDTQQPCTHDSGRCRAEQMLVVRRTNGSWCGGSTCFRRRPGLRGGPVTFDQRGALIVNDDVGTNVRWEDHIIPALVALDSYRFGMSWLDLRGDPMFPDNSTIFNIASALVDMRRFPPYVPNDNPRWPGSTGLFENAVLDTNYGDFNQPTPARLHTHFVNSGNTITGSVSYGLTRLVSPFTGP